MRSGGRRRAGAAALAALAGAAALALPAPAAAIAAAAAALAAAALAAAPAGGRRPPAAGDRAAPSRPLDAADLAALLDPLPQGVLLLDGELNVLAANRALARIVGHPLEGMAGASLIRATREIELVAVARERPAGPREARLASGAEAVLSAAPIDLPLAAGRAELLVAAEDVTALRAARRARSDLVANLSHELRTPLAGARAIAETFPAAADDPAERARFLGLLGDEIERMSGIVDRMLRLAQIESVRDPAAPETLAPADLLAAAAARAAPVAAQRRIRVEVAGGAAAGPAAGRRESAGEVLGNLLDNALRHSPDGGLVTLAAHNGDGEVRFEVRDEGPGILPSERERVFERFYTGDAARGARGGSGLGLAIARQLVQQQGGRIWVADRSPGATVCFSLPLAGEGGGGG